MLQGDIRNYCQAQPSQSINYIGWLSLIFTIVLSHPGPKYLQVALISCQLQLLEVLETLFGNSLSHSSSLLRLHSFWFCPLSKSSSFLKLPSFWSHPHSSHLTHQTKRHIKLTKPDLQTKLAKPNLQKQPSPTNQTYNIKLMTSNQLTRIYQIKPNTQNLSKWIYL